MTLRGAPREQPASPDPVYRNIKYDGTATDAALSRASAEGATVLQFDGYYLVIVRAQASDPSSIGTKSMDQTRAPAAQPGIEWHESYYENGVRKIHVHRIENGIGYVEPVSVEIP